ncbi:secondary thiamine-phosphate synthase enzyme [Candidatus Roizmanbacteria bacterium CG22_combo_CG10-13_8_21_14_all_35_9]|uniref:Secondary thiamine-phosphate synthase enzyme n=4 Tax=Candidatus Roizmaniibacteriota TaxID=1752723 RepID=A0A2M8F486_9BACT|nr:MAG: secondary thiamine-phosphate synthase enzyme [Candidatus Roizmanbacteria bacterium CG23_combo_of_CG06-09_8_20_14_all_35_49]PIP62693.1 MAG: secondary thiamine-phosphate synthase enzyme [Candidatus Roizmanbacteria bacterium CG22_combo_CG10-13_8_21_14_all_35_9]PIY71096.1 MAG: secondary thiamine-phosphate synthase enzyme [Candidatus Roizmanbacteria bacterium CG_4_10_14_0_8_um_filter_35_28]PJC34098.1 MAG: secondary thiamine-phosphate synthase enzyme [Candidatus Roizmanbacteria bacterium CG_4_
MKIISKTIKLKSKKSLEFIDLTDLVKKFVFKSKIKNGSVSIYSKHTTMAVRINEKEKGIVEDFVSFIKKLLPKNAYYRHNDLTIRTENLVCEPGVSDCLNGHSHCLHLLLGSSEAIPIISGKLMLGIWQRIFAIELDCGRNREIIIQIIGN